uniref:Uncharacterized protein n=1 Tax=Amphimedon queenslandica TaxID=400682 RepID=A0A1X7U4L3_AMPQE
MFTSFWKKVTSRQSQLEFNSTSPVGGLFIDESSAHLYFGGYLEDNKNDEDEEDIVDKSSDNCTRQYKALRLTCKFSSSENMRKLRENEEITTEWI